MRYARTFLGRAQVAETEAKLAKCLRFELKFHSVITETAKGYGYYYELRLATTLRAAGSVPRAAARRSSGLTCTGQPADPVTSP